MGFNVEHWWPDQELEYPMLFIMGEKKKKKEVAAWQFALIFKNTEGLLCNSWQKCFWERGNTATLGLLCLRFLPIIFIDLKLLWPRENLFYSVYYIIKMMKSGINREEGIFLSENFLLWVFCPRYIQPGLLGAFCKCLMVCWRRPGQKGQAGNFSDTNLLCFSHAEWLITIPVILVSICSQEKRERGALWPTLRWESPYGLSSVPLAIYTGSQEWLLLPEMAPVKSSETGWISAFLSCFSPGELFLQPSDLLLAVEGCITHANWFTFEEVFQFVPSV